MADTISIRSFIDSLLTAPEDRVNREGAPDYRPVHREAKLTLFNVVASKIRPNVRVQRFKYSPINPGEIRLLAIQRGAPGQPLRCYIFPISLSKAQGCYEALSYCWGDEEPTEKVLLRNLEPMMSYEESDKKDGSFPEVAMSLTLHPFPIRPNLYKALCQLRSREKYTLVWVDAICMDQSGTKQAEKEKDEQLSMMAEIYSSAHNVCVWLGEEDENSQVAMQLIRDIMDFKAFDEVNNANDGVEKWTAFIHSMQAPWFGRRWIIQEVALARHASVHFGEDVVHWDDLADALGLLNEKAAELKIRHGADLFGEVETLSATALIRSLDNVCRKSDDGSVFEKVLDLETLVSTLLLFRAKFPRDIIYSVLSLAKDAPKPQEEQVFRITADHKKSTRDLYVAFVNRCIEISRCLDIICRHWAPPVVDALEHEVKLPSWVSPLSKSPFGLPGEARGRQNGENLVGLSSHDIRKKYNACGGREAKFERPPETGRQVEVSENEADATNENHTIAGSDLVESPVDNAGEESSNMFVQPLKSKHEEIPRSPEVDGWYGRALPNGFSKNHAWGFRNPISRPDDKELGQPVPNSDALKDALQTFNATSGFGQTPIATLGSAPTTPTQRPASLVPQTGPKKAANAPSTPPPRSPNPVSQPSPKRGPKSPVRKPSKEPSKMDDKERDATLSGILRVTGFILGTVKTHSDVMRGGIVPGDWLRKLGWDRKCKKNRVKDIVWRTLVADRGPDGGKPPGWYQRACLHCLMDTRITDSKGNLSIASPHAKNTSEMTSKFLKRAECVIWNRRLFEAQTNEGITGSLHVLGLAPEGTEAGDILCILFGCTVPVVLRKVNSLGKSDVYELIGEVYVHGMMEGEALQNEDVVNRLEREFLLQ